MERFVDVPYKRDLLQAKASSEKPPVAGENEQSIELKRVREAFLNKNGENVGEVQYSYKAERQDIQIGLGKVLSGVELVTCIIEGPKGRFDIMPLVTSLGVRLCMATEPQENYAYLPTNKVACIPALRSLIPLAIGAHEIGHAGQFHGPLKEYFTHFVDPAPSDGVFPALSTIFTARKYMPEFREKLKIEHFAIMRQVQEYQTKMFNPKQFLQRTEEALKELYERRDRMYAELAQEGVPVSGSWLEIDISTISDAIKQAEAKTHGYRAKLKDAQREIDVRIQLLMKQVPELFELPAIAQKVMEYDATQRALLILEDIKSQTGIDVFADDQIKEDLFAGIPCQGAQETDQGLQDVQKAPNAVDALQVALSTYRASTGQLREKYGEVPRVRRQREAHKASDEEFIKKVYDDMEAEVA